MKLLKLACALCSMAFCLAVGAQNLLTNNPGFEAGEGYYTPGWGWPQGATNILPGWIITLDPAGDGYAGAAARPGMPLFEGAHFAYLYSGYGQTIGMMQTAPGQRAPVDAGTAYTLWFSARGDASWGATHATFSLLWHPNNNNANTVGTPATLTLTFPVQDADEPLLPYTIQAVAPNAAHYASVRVTTPAGAYEPVIFDDFMLLAEPDRPLVSIKKNGSQATVSWQRSATKWLHESDDVSRANSWVVIDKPVRKNGPTNFVEYPLTNSVKFFRVLMPD